MPDTSPAAAGRANIAAAAKAGYTAAASAFVLWGAFPLYFHTLAAVSSLQIIAHRVTWSCVFVLAVMLIRGELSQLRAALSNRAVVVRLIGSAFLITFNWITFVLGVTHGRTVEASLGYFIGPLVNVLMGTVLLSERLTKPQWTAVAIACIGVGYLTILEGHLPWIALSLAVTFSAYGLVRKVVKVEALPGLAAETLLLVPVAVGFLIWSEFNGTGAMGHSGLATDALLIGGGPLTAITLFLFAYGTRLLPYSTIGVLQYIAPSLQFLCGVFALHEPFDHARAIGFAVIWSALIIYIVEGMRLSRKQQARSAATA